MSNLKVKDLMRPLDQYTTVSEEATLKDAFLAMEAALQGVDKADPREPRDFAVLVIGRDGRVLGRLVVWDVLQGLDPKTVRALDSLSMVEGFRTWEQPLAHLAEKAQNFKVKDLVKSLRKGEYIDEEASINEALHRLITQRFLSLIALRGSEAVGILRVVDVFQHVCGEIRSGLR